MEKEIHLEVAPEALDYFYTYPFDQNFGARPIKRMFQRDVLNGLARFLIAQKSPNELKGHIRGAINNGATVAEIREVLMHSLPYCGGFRSPLG